MTEQIGQYYFEVVDTHFSNNGHFLDLTGSVDFVGRKAKSLDRMNQLTLLVLQENFNTYFQIGEHIEGLDLRKAWQELRKSIIGLFLEILTPEETEKFVQTTEECFVALYDLDDQPQDLLGIGFNDHTKANLMGDDKPDVYINLHHLIKIKRGFESIIMEMRLNGEVILEEEENHLKQYIVEKVEKDVRVSITHELLHWLKRIITGLTGSESEEDEEIIERLARSIADPDNDEVKRLDKAQLATFLCKTLK